MDRVRPRFARFEPARHVAALTQGLLSGCRGRTVGRSPNAVVMRLREGSQHLLSWPRWDADLVRDGHRSGELKLEAGRSLDRG